MSDSLTNITTALSTLTIEELDDVINAAELLKSVKQRKNNLILSNQESLFYHALIKTLRDNGHPRIPPGEELAKSPRLGGFKKPDFDLAFKSVEMTRTKCKVPNKNETIAFYLLCSRLVYVASLHSEPKSESLIHRIFLNFQRVEHILDDQFPDYIASGLFGLVLRAKEITEANE